MLLRRAAVRLGLVVLVATAVLVLPRSAPGTVAEQRQRLPPPAECTDEVEGRWKAHVYDERFRVWHAFHLEVHRVAGSEVELRGKISVRVWHGDAKQQEPGACHGETHYLLTQQAKGAVKEGEIHFWGTSQKLEQVLCGRFGAYNLDHFSGKIDKALQEFQSVNNDGGLAVNQPTVFRRIGCFDEPPPPDVEVKPPPIFRSGADKKSGCGCGVGPG